MSLLWVLKKKRIVGCFVPPPPPRNTISPFASNPINVYIRSECSAKTRFSVLKVSFFMLYVSLRDSAPKKVLSLTNFCINITHCIV